MYMVTLQYLGYFNIGYYYILNSVVLPDVGPKTPCKWTSQIEIYSGKVYPLIWILFASVPLPVELRQMVNAVQAEQGITALIVREDGNRRGVEVELPEPRARHIQTVRDQRL